MSSEAKPMKPDELGRYVCVVHPAPSAGGCLHSPHITIDADGVWVRQNTGPYDVTGTVSSAHRDCYEAWQRNDQAKAIEHTHSYRGQSLRHSHPGGDESHGYYGHPEDIPPAGVNCSKNGLFGPDDRIWQQYPA